MAMLDKHKKVLKKNHVQLVKEVIPNEELVGYLYANDVLTDNMREEIEAIPKEMAQKRNRTILTNLPKRGAEAFPTYVQALVESGQDHLANLLDKGIADGYRSRDGEDGAEPTYPNPSAPPAGEACHYVNPVNPVLTREEILPEGGLFPQCSKLQNASPDLIQRVITDPISNFKIGRNPRGRCIIVNVEKFSEDSNKSDRDGSWADVTNLTEVFKKLHFEIDLWDNLTAAEIKAKIKVEKKKEVLKEHEMFVMAILSHGKENTVYGMDGREVLITEDIVSSFNGVNCPALINKPKIFFIQACQGKGKTIGVVPDDAGEGRTEDDAGAVTETPDTEAVHEEADLLIVTGTVPGYKAWRNTINGSWFITDLTVALVQHAHDKHLQEIVTIVTRYVSDRSRDKTGHKQICQQSGQLRRDLYLLPGYERPV